MSGQEQNKERDITQFLLQYLEYEGAKTRCLASDMTLHVAIQTDVMTQLLIKPVNPDYYDPNQFYPKNGYIL